MGACRFVHRSLAYDEFVRRVEAAEVPFAAAASLDEVLTNPQVAHAKVIVAVDHPTLGTYRVARSAARFGGTPVDDALRAAPTLGQHTAEVLASVP